MWSLSLLYIFGLFGIAGSQAPQKLRMPMRRTQM
ncbi:hypothetical protein EE36_13853 [Sulfitobacter sp. EE-36]|nr:hypothetical protein EE36_13853 [Sulfitobacter sp. EE-36]